MEMGETQLSTETRANAFYLPSVETLRHRPDYKPDRSTRLIDTESEA